MKRLLLLCAALTLAACSHQVTTTTSVSSAPDATASAAATDTPGAEASSASTAPVASPSASPAATAMATVAVSFTDLSGIFGSEKITQLAQLGVFESTSGAFEPNKPIARRIFARWLFKANNALYARDDTKQFRQASAGDQSAFKDVASNDPDFPYIQGLQNAGVSVGFPDKTFRPDVPITREQALAIKAQVDKGGVDERDQHDPTQARYELPSWKDKADISVEYVAAINTETFDDLQHADNVGRTFGAISNLRPKQPLTRAQAAVMLWKIGDHAMHSSNARTAADALAPASPSP